MQISVVIPLYNKEKYISRAIDSVLNQSVQPAEIIIVNDGSTDNSENVVKQNANPKIRIITQENAGVGNARNRGAKEATFDLIAFLDADDEWKPDFLRNIQRLYNNFPDCGAYATAYEIIDPDGSRAFPQIKEVPPAPWIGIIPNLFKLMQGDLPFSSSSIAITKEALQKTKGFPEGIKLGEDKMMWIQLGYKYPIAYCADAPVIYHREAISRSCDTYSPQNELTAIDFLEGLIENNKIPMPLTNDAKDLAAYFRIQRSRLLVLIGYPKIARKLLKKIHKNPNYSYSKLKWCLISLLPQFLIQRIQRLRSSQSKSE